MNRKRHTLDNIPSTNNLLLNTAPFFFWNRNTDLQGRRHLFGCFFSGDWNHKMI